MKRQLLGSVLIAATLALAITDATARGPWRASGENTRGWQFMTPEERIEHQSRIRSFTTLAECRAYQQQHHQEMEARARAQGLALPGGARDICAHLKPVGSPDRKD